MTTYWPLEGAFMLFDPSGAIMADKFAIKKTNSRIRTPSSAKPHEPKLLQFTKENLVLSVDDCLP